MTTTLIIAFALVILALIYIALVKRIGDDQKQNRKNFLAANPPATSEPRGSCPCLYTTPCSPECTCVNPYSSYGCNRCCSYGNLEQRSEMAEFLVRLMKGTR